MAWKASLLLLCFILGVFAQTRVQKSIIDDYSVVSPVLVIVINDTSVLPFQLSESVQDSTILGGERDLILQALTGSEGRVFTSDVSTNEWTLSAPNGASCLATTQYDGLDNSAVLAPKGLGGVDLTTSLVDSFKLTIETDIDTNYVITVYDMSGGSASYNIAIPANPDVSNDYYITFVSFTGNADFTNVGALTVDIHGFANVDSLVDIFSLAAPDTSPPPPNPSTSPIPGDTWYRFDDDEDNQSPCGEEADENTVFLADYNIIYYYFYGFQRPYVYVSNPNFNDASFLIPSVFACVFALFAL